MISRARFRKIRQALQQSDLGGLHFSRTREEKPGEVAFINRSCHYGR